MTNVPDLVKHVEETAQAMVALRPDLREAHEKVTIELTLEPGDDVNEVYEGRRKILQIRRRLLNLVTEARESEGMARLQRAEADRCRLKIKTEWQVLEPWQKEDLQARIIMGDANADGAIAKIQQCQMELEFDLSYVREITDGIHPRSISD